MKKIFISMITALSLCIMNIGTLNSTAVYDKSAVDSTTFTEEEKIALGILVPYEDEETKLELRESENFESVMRIYSIPLRFAFTEYDNVDDVLTGREFLGTYYMVQHKDGTRSYFDSDYKQLESHRYTINNGEEVILPPVDISEKAFEVYNSNGFTKKNIAFDAKIEAKYYLYGETCMMGTAIYYKTNKGDYVYYDYNGICSAFFTVDEFCEYQKKINDYYAQYPEHGGGADSDMMPNEDSAISNEDSYVNYDANGDGVFNVADVVVFQKWLLGAGELPCGYNVDIVEDATLNIFDLMLMKSALLEKMKAPDLNVQYEPFSRDYPYYNIVDDLAKKANQVFEGRINNISFEMLDMRTMQPLKDGEDSVWTMIFTIYDIEVEKIYAGSENSVKLCIEGGISYGFEHEQLALLGSEKIPVMENAPTLTIGTKYLFALYHADGAEYSSVLNPLQSIYKENDVQTGSFSATDIISYFS